MAKLNEPPKFDGDVTEYESQKKKLLGKYWNKSRRVFYINGMDNQPKHHRDAAMKLSYIQLCKVVGVFNSSNGFWPDVGQCVSDKGQFGRKFRDEFRTATFRSSFFEKERRLKQELSMNKAAISLFKEIQKSSGETHIFAHSQGNLILSNVLYAISLLLGEKGLNRFTVHSFGSPTRNWPRGIKHLRRGYSNDWINMMSGIDWSFSISKIKHHKGASLFSHDFMYYLEDDAEFTINHFSWGNANKISMDEDGLASALVKMGANIPRVTKIFKRLDAHHNFDVDDVAFLYLEKIRHNSKVQSAVKNDITLNKLLYKSLDEGWTTKAEYKAMARLRN